MAMLNLEKTNWFASNVIGFGSIVFWVSRYGLQFYSVLAPIIFLLAVIAKI